MNIQDLKNRFENVADADSDIETFVFDDLSAINRNRSKQYPVVLLKVMPSSIPNYKTTTGEPIYEDYEITFFVFKTWTNQNKKDNIELATRYSETQSIGLTYLKAVLDASVNNDVFMFNKSIQITRGHFKHVDQLVGTQFDFILRVYYGCN